MLGDDAKKRKKKKRVTSGGSSVSVESYFETGADGKVKLKVRVARDQLSHCRLAVVTDVISSSVCDVYGLLSGR